MNGGGRPMRRSPDRPPQQTAAILEKETAVAKGQKKSNREVRKPKADKPKPSPAPPGFLAPASKKK
jgi:hypothetical protein